MVAAAAVGIFLAAWPGCGSDDGEDARAIRSAFAELRRDLERRDLDSVCAHMSASAQRHLGLIGHGTPTRCRVDLWEFVRSLEGRGDPPTARVVEVEVDGDSASVLAVLAGETRARVPFVREDGTWKIDNFFGISRFPPRGG